jgi:hypothetical protein
VSAFDALEADFFDELAKDTHGVWELFGFVRLHHPELTNEHAVFTCGRDYIGRWIDRGWIRIADAPLYPSTIASASEITTFLDQHGEATWYDQNAPSIDISEEGQRVYQSERSNQSLQATAGRSDD